MQHATLKATTTEVDTELGTFTALVSAWVEDRENDSILPTAFDTTIEAWRASGRQVPLLFEHSAVAIGSIDPVSMHPTEEGLVVNGEVDRSTDAGKQVWRMIKNSTASFSIGFMSESRRRKGGGREIYEVDLLEVSATATPVHPSARVLSWKSAATIEEMLTESERETYQQVRDEWKAKRGRRRLRLRRRTTARTGLPCSHHRTVCSP